MTVAPVDISPTSMPDRLAGALLRNLHRQPSQVRIGSAARATLELLLTFGLWPLIRWPRRLRDVTVIQRMQFEHLSDWLAGQYHPDQLAPLHDAIERIRFRVWLWVGSIIAIGIGLGELIEMRHLPQPGLRGLIALFWRQADPDFAHVWNWSLAFAYLLHWLQVKLHARDVQRAIAAFNALTHPHRLAPVSPARASYRLFSWWTVAAVLFAMAGAWWGIAAMLAGATQRNYTGFAVPAMRRSLADRLRELLRLHRPHMEIPTPVWMTQRCPNKLCGHTVPPHARFCPRCGSPMHLQTIDTRG